VGVAGSIKEIPVADLIQQNCLDKKNARLVIQNGELQAQVFFSGGAIVHALLGNQSGEEVIFEILQWEDGSFILDKEITSPARTITNTWAALLLEGARRIDEKIYQKQVGDRKELMMNAKLFPKVIDTLKEDLGDGLVASDVYTTADGQSLAGFNSNPKACALFNEITRYLHKSLKGSGFPGLGGYYMVQLENNMAVVVISHGEIQNGMLVDLSKTTMGLLLNVALPKVMALIDEAMKS
jgi:hypothetical protein